MERPSAAQRKRRPWPRSIARFFPLLLVSSCLSICFIRVPVTVYSAGENGGCGSRSSSSSSSSSSSITTGCIFDIGLDKEEMGRQAGSKGKATSRRGRFLLPRVETTNAPKSTSACWAAGIVVLRGVRCGGLVLEFFERGRNARGMDVWVGGPTPARGSSLPLSSSLVSVYGCRWIRCLEGRGDGGVGSRGSLLFRGFVFGSIRFASSKNCRVEFVPDFISTVLVRKGEVGNRWWLQLLLLCSCSAKWTIVRVEGASLLLIFFLLLGSDVLPLVCMVFVRNAWRV
ncbi:uncharacterized protein BKA78DRAFT_188742 [Phyllosticta capitalensis]|uniref:uncharacterized protein n=1 Tax=Phyllosticta capitalensis TaxID=121624 RepID=UPI00312DC91A